MTHLEAGAAPFAQRALRDLQSSYPEHAELAELKAKVSGTEEVVAGVKAFFMGNLEESIRALTSARTKHSDRADLLAVLGAAHATRGLLRDGQAKDEDLSLAREIFQQAVRSQPGLSLDTRYFSPRIIEVFNSAL